MDQYHDPCGVELEKIARVIDLPVDVDNKRFDRASLTGLNKEAFAFSEERLFPIHTPEDTLISAAYFLTRKKSFGREVDERIDSMIKAAAYSHGVLDKYLELCNEIKESLEKTAHYQEKEYAVTYRVGNNNVKVYPVNSPDELKKSASNYEIEYLKLTPELRKSAARKFLEKAAYYNIELNSDIIDAHAGIRGVDLEKSAEYLIYRAKRSKNQSAKELLVKLAKSILVTPEAELDFEKLASIVDKLDYVSGNHNLVRKGSIPDGALTFFNKPLIEKVAGIRLAGKEFSEEDIKSLPVEKFAEALGEDFVKEASKDGKFDYDSAMDIIETLPRPDAKILATYIEGNKCR